MLILFSCKKRTNGLTQRSEKYFAPVSWHKLGYKNQTEDTIRLQLGKPDEEKIVNINYCDYRLLDSLHRELLHLVPYDEDSVLVKELFWNQSPCLLYIWFIQKDSVWHAVDGAKYEPNNKKPSYSEKISPEIIEEAVKYLESMSSIWRWDKLGYQNQTENTICLQLGKPDRDIIISLNHCKFRTLAPLHRPLTRFIPLDEDTVLIKELFWEQSPYLLYIWLIEKDAVWHAVDGIKYDPKRVEL